MFEFLFKRDEALVPFLEIITEDSAKVKASKFAIEKAVTMIGKAIAKSEIVLQDANGRRTDEYYYRLNVRPNDNETGTDFWMKAVRKLVLNGECLICPIADKYYIAESWTENEFVMKPREYSNITISAAGKQTAISKKYKAGNVIHLKYDNEKLREYLNDIVTQYDKLLGAMATAQKIAAMPKYKLMLNAKMTLAERTSDGETKIITKDQYAEKLKGLLTSDDISMLTLSEGVDISQIKLETATKLEDIRKAEEAAFDDAAMAFDIPREVFKGNITEKSDATNEFITFAVTPIAEVINDGLNAALVGEEDYVDGERIFVWLSKFKHVDVIDSASNLDKLRSIGFTLDEIFELIGYPQLHTQFSSERALTKNYSTGENENQANRGSKPQLRNKKS